MLIRRLDAADDLDLAGSLVVRAYETLTQYRPDEEYRSVIGDVRGRVHDTTVVGAFIAGTLVGCLTFVEGPTAPHAEHNDVEAATFRYFGVDPDCQSSGVGRQMVEWVMAESRRLGRKRVFIHTIPAMKAAIRLYESLGFVRQPELDQTWDGVVGWAFVKEL